MNVIIDADNLFWRAFHGAGLGKSAVPVTPDEAETRSIAGFLISVDGIARTVDGLSKRLARTRDRLYRSLSFAFDRCGAREVEFPWYKESRRSRKEDSVTASLREAACCGLYRLRMSILPGVGFRSVFSQEGREADDVIASFCANNPGRGTLIVSSDHDLYQLLSAGAVSVYDPGTKAIVTHDSFTREYGIAPAKWPAVKALGGCSADDVLGASMVGEKTAIKFLTGRLEKKTSPYRRCADFFKTKEYKDNLRVVTLPFPGTREFRVVEDNAVDPGKWSRLLREFGVSVSECGMDLLYERDET